MMRALRSSLYVGPYDTVTTVLLECDATDTLESGAQLRVPGALVIHEIFEAPSDDIESATLEAVKRQQANGEQEAHQAMLFYWTVHAWETERIKPGGTIFMDKPTPLSRAEIAEVFEQLAEHPEYTNYHIVSHTRDGEPVVLVKGKVTPW